MHCQGHSSTFLDGTISIFAFFGVVPGGKGEESPTTLWCLLVVFEDKYAHQ